MISVSLAPATPKARAADPSTTAAKASDDGARFDALLRHASGNETDMSTRNRSDARSTQAKEKAPGRVPSAPTNGGSPESAEGPGSRLASVDGRVATLGAHQSHANSVVDDVPQTGDEEALPDTTTAAAETGCAPAIGTASTGTLAAPVAAAIDASQDEKCAPDQLATPTSLDASATSTLIKTSSATATAASNSAAERMATTTTEATTTAATEAKAVVSARASSVSGSPESTPPTSIPARTAAAAKEPGSASAELTPQLPAQDGDGRVPSGDRARRRDTERAALAGPKNDALPAVVRSPEWSAAAAALREALEKVATPGSTPDPSLANTSSVPGSSNLGSATAAPRLGISTTAGMAGEQRAAAKESGLRGAAIDDGVVLTAASLTDAVKASGRQTSADSHSDSDQDTPQSYKAPAKAFAGVPVFAMTTAFGRALEHAAPAAPVMPPVFTSGDLASVGPQIVKGLQLHVTAKGGDMRLTLTPEHLGTVSIEVRVEHDRVTATLTADTPAVRQWITAHQDDLRQSLTAAGLTLEDLVVREDGQQEKPPSQDERDAPPRKRRNDAAGKDQRVFEVIV